MHASCFHVIIIIIIIIIMPETLIQSIDNCFDGGNLIYVTSNALSRNFNQKMREKSAQVFQNPPKTFPKPFQNPAQTRPKPFQNLT